MKRSSDVNYLLAVARDRAIEQDDPRAKTIDVLLNCRISEIAEKIAEVEAQKYNTIVRKYYSCPECGAKGGWRNGVNFEHQMRCYEGHVWEPDSLARKEYDKTYPWEDDDEHVEKTEG